MKRVTLLLASIICINFLPALAQDDTAQVTLRITSNPPGVTVNLDGPYQLTTTTPTDITQELIGTFKVRAEKFGYESWNSYITIAPNQPASLRISLSPKTRVKAALRSAVLPGWGQFYSGRKGWGYFFATGSLILAAGFVISDLHYSNQYDQFVDVRNDFQAATSFEEINNLKQKMDDEQREAYDAQSLRNTALGIGIAFWGYSMLDNLVFFPSVQSGVFEKLSTDYDPKSGQVKLTYTHALDF